MSVEQLKKEKRAIRRNGTAGFLALLLLVGGLGGWSAFASISGAVIAAGSVVQESANKRIQYDNVGIIKKIRIVEGQRVKQGDVLIELDDTRLNAELNTVRKRLFEQKAKRLRLLAIRDGQRHFQTSKAMMQEARADRQLKALLSVQKRLFATTHQRFKNQKQQLKERIIQLKQEIGGFQMQMKSQKKADRLLAREIRGLKSLRGKKLISLQRLNPIMQNKNKIESNIGRLTSDIANANGRISEARLKIIEIEEAYRNENLKELEKAEGDILALQEQYITARDRMKRTLIRAPQAGYVHELKFFTNNGVIQPGETLMFVVPDSQHLIVEAKVPPTSIDQITLGQQATIRFTAFNQRTTPDVTGVVKFLSPDQIVNERTGDSYFTVRIRITPKEKNKLAGKQISAGMPAEVMIETTKRTVLSYLTKPLADQLNRSFREE